MLATMLPSSTRPKVNEQQEQLLLRIFLGTYEGLLIGYNVFKSISNQEDHKVELFFNAHDHHTNIQCVRVSEHGLVASGGADEIIQIYDGVKRVDLTSLCEHDGNVTSLSWIKDSYLLSTSVDGTVCAWNSSSWKLEHKLATYKSGVTSMAVHPKGKVALSAGQDKTLRTWNLESGKVVYTTNLKYVCEQIVWSPLGNHYLLVATNQIVLHATETASELQRFECQGRVNCVIFITDDVMCVGDQSREIKLFSKASSHCLRSFVAHESRVKCLEFYEGEELLISSSSDGSIKLWHVDSKEILSKNYEPTLRGQVNCGCRITSMSLLDMSRLDQVNALGISKKKVRSKSNVNTNRKVKGRSQSTPATSNNGSLKLKSNKAKEKKRRDATKPKKKA